MTENNSGGIGILSILFYILIPMFVAWITVSDTEDKVGICLFAMIWAITMVILKIAIIGFPLHFLIVNPILNGIYNMSTYISGFQGVYYLIFFVLYLINTVYVILYVIADE